MINAITAGQKHRRLQNGIPSIECELSPGPVVSRIALLKEDATLDTTLRAIDVALTAPETQPHAVEGITVVRDGPRREARVVLRAELRLDAPQVDGDVVCRNSKVDTEAVGAEIKRRASTAPRTTAATA